MKGTFYSEQLNIKLLMNLGAHIGHAKIDWNTDNNAYLAGLTNNNYIIFNINKTLYFFKRSLNFMHLVGYNNGKFVIYYPGDNSFYKLVMEGALDKEGLLPTKYPFIHSIVKPGFFSNWRVNYKRLVRQFFKVIFWNPYFFGGMTTKFLHKHINELTFKKGINKHMLNNIRLQHDQWIQTMSNSLRVNKKIQKSHFRSFKPKFKIHKKLLDFSLLKEKSIHDQKYEVYISNSNKYLYSLVEYYYLTFFKKNSIHNHCFNNAVNSKSISLLNNLKSSFFLHSNINIDLLFINLRCNYGHSHFMITSQRSNHNILVRHNSLFIPDELKLSNPLKSFYNGSLDSTSSLTDFIANTIKHVSPMTQKIFEAYFELKQKKSNKSLKSFLKSRSLISIVQWADYMKRIKSVLNLKPLIIRFLKRKQFLNNLTPELEKKIKRKYYYSKMRVSNKQLYLNFRRNMKKGANFLPVRYSDAKIDSNLNMITEKHELYQFNQRKAMENTRTRTESLKMLYYNIYSMLISIAFRKDKYHNNSDNLTPYEQKFFRKFVKFILIFRYLKRIKLVPSAIILLNSDVHESQYTDFKNLNTAVIGLADTNISFNSLSYFIPTNDDNLILFLYYVKMLTHTFTLGRKHSILENLIPKFSNNLSRRASYESSYIYQYKDKLNLNDESTFLPIGSQMEKLHIYRLEERRKEREAKQQNFLKWKAERQEHRHKKGSFDSTNKDAQPHYKKNTSAQDRGRLQSRSNTNTRPKHEDQNIQKDSNPNKSRKKFLMSNRYDSLIR